MQTFIWMPGDDPRQAMWESLYYLDRQRLGKQRVEASQLLDAIDDPGHGWRSHPACKMWMPYRAALVDYYNLSLKAWEARGYRNDLLKLRDAGDDIVYPPFITQGPLRASHRACLVIKNENYYARFVTDTDAWDRVNAAKLWAIGGGPEPKTTANMCKRTYHWPSAATAYV